MNPDLFAIIQHDKHISYVFLTVLGFRPGRHSLSLDKSPWEMGRGTRQRRGGRNGTIRIKDLFISLCEVRTKDL